MTFLTSAWTRVNGIVLKGSIEQEKEKKNTNPGGKISEKTKKRKSFNPIIISLN